MRRLLLPLIFVLVGAAGVPGFYWLLIAFADHMVPYELPWHITDALLTFVPISLWAVAGTHIAAHVRRKRGRSRRPRIYWLWVWVAIGWGPALLAYHAGEWFPHVTIGPYQDYALPFVMLWAVWIPCTAAVCLMALRDLRVALAAAGATPIAVLPYLNASIETSFLVMGSAWAVAIFAGLAWWGFLAPLPRHLGECSTCGYDLSGLPPSSPCPECGETDAAKNAAATPLASVSQPEPVSRR